MTAHELITRKFDSGLSDLQFLVLITLATETMTLTELSEKMGRFISTVCGSCTKMIDSGYVQKTGSPQPYQPSYYSITDLGRERLTWVLGKLPKDHFERK